MKSISYQLKAYVLLDAIVFVFSIYKGYVWIANTQIAFFSSLAIVLLSYLSYVKNINKQIDLVSDIIDDRDLIDEMNDPYELYDETPRDKKNKLKLSAKNLSKSKGAALSFFRIIGYMLLIGGFFLLLKMESFSILPYMIGVSIIPFGSLMNILIYKGKLYKN